MPKRRRTSSRAAPRPIDKSLVAVDKTVSNSQLETDIIVSTFPCTATGIRWDMHAIQNAGTGEISCLRWAIVLVEDGSSADIMNSADGANFYQPEQNVLAFGIVQMDNNPPEGVHISGSTKTMRKLKIGDSIKFICLGVSTNTTRLIGVVQIFCKS